VSGLGCLGLVFDLLGHLFILLLLTKFVYDAWQTGLIPPQLLTSMAIVFAVFLGLGEGSVAKVVRGGIGLVGLTVFLAATPPAARGGYWATAGMLILAYAGARFLYLRFSDPLRPWRWGLLHWLVLGLLVYVLALAVLRR